MIGLADRWHKLPEEIEKMDASGMRLLAILQRGRPDDEREEVT